MRRITAIVAIFGLLAMMFYPILAITSPAAKEAEEVYIPDRGLETAIREEIANLYLPIYVKDLEGLTRLGALERGIADLTGMEYCTDLKVLNLAYNKITDLSPLLQLVNLKVLNLAGNKITDLSPLSHLTNLEWLSLESNKITDLSPLSQLVNLEHLNLWYNKITDLSPLVLNSGLSEGDVVWLTHNPLSETSIEVYISQLERRGVVVDWDT